MTSTWGPQVWCFLHKLVSSIKDESFHIIGSQALTYIIQICSMLPCPDCSNHARMFFNKIRMSSINTRTKLIDLIYLFHNEVNKQTKKNIVFPYNSLNIYDNINLYTSYNDFVKVYKINTSSKLNTDTFHKSMLLKNLHNWLISNNNHFIPIYQNPIPSPDFSQNFIQPHIEPTTQPLPIYLPPPPPMPIYLPPPPPPPPQQPLPLQLPLPLPLHISKHPSKPQQPQSQSPFFTFHYNPPRPIPPPTNPIQPNPNPNRPVNFRTTLHYVR